MHEMFHVNTFEKKNVEFFCYYCKKVEKKIEGLDIFFRIDEPQSEQVSVNGIFRNVLFNNPRGICPGGFRPGGFLSGAFGR